MGYLYYYELKVVVFLVRSEFMPGTQSIKQAMKDSLQGEILGHFSCVDYREFTEAVRHQYYTQGFVDRTNGTLY